MVMMGGVVVGVSISPTSISDHSAASSWTFGSVTVTVLNGTASSYTWSFSGENFGTYAITSGAGTATATAHVDVSFGSNTTANMDCAVVVNGITYNKTCALSYTIAP